MFGSPTKKAKRVLDGIEGYFLLMEKEIKGLRESLSKSPVDIKSIRNHFKNLRHLGGWETIRFNTGKFASKMKNVPMSVMNRAKLKANEVKQQSLERLSMVEIRELPKKIREGRQKFIEALNKLEKDVLGEIASDEEIRRQLGFGRI